MSKRYELRIGKFGMYFYDTFSDEDVSLQDVLHILNAYEDNRQRPSGAISAQVMIELFNESGTKLGQISTSGKTYTKEF